MPKVLIRVIADERGHYAEEAFYDDEVHVGNVVEVDAEDWREYKDFLETERSWQDWLATLSGSTR